MADSLAMKPISGGTPAIDSEARAAVTPDNGIERQRPPQFGDVPRAGADVDFAHHQEQRGLEQGMGEENGHAGEGGLGRAEGEQDDHEPELRHRAPGQDQLGVTVAESGHRPPQHGCHPQASPHDLPAHRVAQRRTGQRHEQHARLHHGGGVQVGADRRGRGHRPREPDVKRHLSRLGGGTDQDQHRGQGRGGPRGRAEVADGVDAGGPDQQQQAGQQHQPADTGDHEGSAGGGPHGGVGVLVTDQQK